MRVKVLHSRPHYDVAEDGENLVGIEHPLLLLQAVHLIETLDLSVHHLGTPKYHLHLADRRTGGLELVKHQLALAVWLVAKHVVIEGVITLTGFETGLDGVSVETELLLYVKCSRLFFLQHSDDLLKPDFPLFVELKRTLIDSIVERFIFKEDGGSDGE